MTRSFSIETTVGLAMCGGGLAAAYYASERYSVGTLDTIGPGFLPIALGLILAGLGAAIAAASYIRSAAAETFETRPFAVIIASLAAFALTVERVGIAPATMVLTVISMFAHSRSRPIEFLAMPLILAALATGIFAYLLKVPVAIVRVPL